MSYEGRAVDLAHVRINGHGDMRLDTPAGGLEMRIKRDSLQRAHRNQRTGQRETQALGKGYGDTNTGEGTRAASERDRIQRLRRETRLGQQFCRERQYQRMVFARSLKIAFEEESTITECHATARARGLDGEDQGHRRVTSGR